MNNWGFCFLERGQFSRDRLELKFDAFTLPRRLRDRTLELQDLLSGVGLDSSHARYLLLVAPLLFGISEPAFPATFEGF